MKNKGNLLILITAMLWSTSGLFLKSAIGSPVAINGARCIVALGVFAIYENKSFRFKFNKLIVLTAICLALTNALYFMAAKMSTPANAITLQYIAPVFVLLWDSLYHHQKPKMIHLLSISVALIGVIIFFSDGLETGYILGNILAVVAGLCFSGVFFLNTLPGASSKDASKLGFLISFLIAIPFWNTMDFTNTTSNLSILCLGVFQVGLAYIVYAEGIKYTDPVSASLISILEVVFNPMWTFLAYHEVITMKAFFGALLIISSVILVTIYDKDKKEV